MYTRGSCDFSKLSPWVIKAEIKFPNLLGLPLRPLHTVFTDFKTQLLQSGFRFFAELVIVMPTSGSGKYPYFMCLVFSQDTDIFTGLQSCSGSLRSSPTLSFYRLGIWGPEWFKHTPSDPASSTFSRGPKSLSDLHCRARFTILEKVVESFTLSLQLNLCQGSEMNSP